MRDEAAKVASYDAVPCGALAAVELIHVNRYSPSNGEESSDLLLDVLCNVLWVNVNKRPFTFANEC